jgi:hypothetical protein
MKAESGYILNNKLLLFINIFSRARPEIPRVIFPVVNLIINSFDNVSLSYKLRNIIIIIYLYSI